MVEITFNDRKFGFNVIMNSHGKNAIVSKIVNRTLTELGLVVGLRIVEIDGANVEEWHHRKILDRIMNRETMPVIMIFKKVSVFFFHHITRA